MSIILYTSFRGITIDKYNGEVIKYINILYSNLSILICDISRDIYGVPGITRLYELNKDIYNIQKIANVINSFRAVFITFKGTNMIKLVDHVNLTGYSSMDASIILETMPSNVPFNMRYASKEEYHFISDTLYKLNKAAYIDHDYESDLFTKIPMRKKYHPDMIHELTLDNYVKFCSSYQELATLYTLFMVVYHVIPNELYEKILYYMISDENVKLYADNYYKMRIWYFPPNDKFMLY